MGEQIPAIPPGGSGGPANLRQPQGQFIYRSMASCSDPPCAGDRDLGVREDYDVHPDADGMIKPLDGGMSVSPDDPLRLPRHRRPPILGGTGKKPVWETNLAIVPDELVYRQTSDDHGLLEPERVIRLDEFRAQLESTADRWTLNANV